MGRKSNDYLLLDKDFNIVGEINKNDLLKELKLTTSQFINYLTNGGEYKGYTIIEKDDGTELQNDVLIMTSKSGKMNYYITYQCKVYRINSAGKKSYHKPYEIKNRLFVSIGKKNYNLARLYVKAFINRKLKDDEYIIFKDGDFTNITPKNIVIKTQKEVVKEAGKMTNLNKRVGLYKNDKLIKTFYSARSCAKELHYSHGHVAALCNGQYKPSIYDLRWI